MPFSLDPSWTPPGDLLSEKTWFIGTVLVGFGYGTVVALSFLCLISLRTSIRPSNRTQHVIMFICVLLMLTTATLYFGGTTWMTQMSFIDYRLYPGGPAGFQVDFFALPVNAMSNVAAAMANWLSEGLMCWRCIVMYSNDYRYIWVKRGIPILLYTTEVAFGIMWLVQVTRPSSSIWSVVHQVNFTPAYFGLGFALHIMATVAIVSRLLVYRHKISTALGKGHGTQYISIAAIIIESACLLSTLIILVLITYALDHPLQNSFFQFFGVAQMIPPLLIIHRIASGKAWTNQRSIMSTIDVSSRHVQSGPVRINMEALITIGGSQTSRRQEAPKIRTDDRSSITQAETAEPP